MELTKAEEQIMQILWRLEHAFVKEIVAEFPDPKPAYNTVSTFVRILEKKDVVAYEIFAGSHRYYPLISHAEYSKKSIQHMVDTYFNKSFGSLVSFFSKNENLSIEEMEAIRNLIDEQIKLTKK
jgi:predicted transcriptional regulator